MNDLRYAFRQLRRAPGFTAAAVLSIALGIGATTAIFSVANALLLRPLPVAEPGRLVSIQERMERGGLKGSHSLPEYLEYRERARSVVDVAAHHLSDVMLNTGAETGPALALDVSGNYFDVLGVRPALGRFFTDEEALGPGAADVAVISHELWRNSLGGDPGVIGRTIHVNSQLLTVIGVAPEGFHGTMLGARPPVWVPVGLYDRLRPGRDIHAWGRALWLQHFGRLAPGVEPAQAEAALTVTALQLADAYDYWEGEAPIGVRLRTFSALPPRMRDGVRGFVALLLATAGLVLAIAMVNVSGMLLARGTARGREMAIRLAVGAGRRRLVSQLLVESLVLAVLGAGAGVLLASWLARLFGGIRPPFAGSFVLDLGLDVRVLAFATGAALLSGVLFGLAPALHATGRDVGAVLKDGAGRGRRTRLRSVLVVGQIALSLVLLVAAGLFVRTVRSALDTDHGFDPRGVLAFELNVRLNGYDEPQGRAFYDELLERVRGLPGTESATLARIIPLAFTWDQTRVRVPDSDLEAAEAGVPVGFNVVATDYFETLRMPLLAGRGLSETDRAGREPVAVVNQAFARRFWPDESPIGKRVQRGGEETEVVGLVPDGKYQSYTEGATPYMYLPFDQHYDHGMWLQVRWRGDPAATVAAVRREIGALDANAAPIVVTTVEDVLGASLFPQRLAARLVGGFGLVGLALAAVGIFGLLSFIVAQRTREIGVRMALGAGRRAVVGMVLRDGLVLLAAGTLIGLAVALAATRVLASLLHGVSPGDPVTLAAVCAVLAAVTMAAALAPARRAARIDPMEALRHE